MYIKKVLVLSLFLCLMVSSVYASNIGRKVYGVLAESAAGVHFDADSSDADSIHLYPWEGTISPSDVVGSAPEGLKFTRLQWNAYTTWVGCGWTSTNSNGYHNMSAYYDGKIKFLVRSSDFNVKKCRVGIKIKGLEIYKTLESLGFSADGQWQELTFDLNTSTDSRLTSANLAETAVLFIVSQNTNLVDGNILDIDYIRWIKPNTADSFNVTVKKVSDNSTVSTSNITWKSSTFQTGWQVAEQYLEIDYDKDSSNKDWNVKLYVNNGSKNRNGLYVNKAGKDYVMTMCWRATDKALPYSDSDGNHTLQIAENYNIAGGYYYLYDSGNSSSTALVDPVWLYMQDLTKLVDPGDEDPLKVKDYSTVMGYKTGGYHARSGDYSDPSNNGYLSGSKVCLYLGADCDAAGGLKYQGNILVVLEYE